MGTKTLKVTSKWNMFSLIFGKKIKNLIQSNHQQHCFEALKHDRLDALSHQNLFCKVRQRQF